MSTTRITSDQWAEWRFNDARDKRTAREKGLVKSAKMSERLAVDWTGRTNQREYHRSAPGSRGGGFDGWYTYRRSRKKVQAALDQLNELYTLTGHAYLHTWTASQWFAPDDRTRVENWRMYVDRFRKGTGLRAYVWCTEWHSGGGPVTGLKHFHMVSVHDGEWDYRKDVLRWSWLYCGSPNGLQVEKVRKSVYYGAKYIAKEASSANPNRSRSRLWACGGLVRAMRFNGEHDAAEVYFEGEPRTNLVSGIVYICPTKVARRFAFEAMEKRPRR